MPQFVTKPPFRNSSALPADPPSEDKHSGIFTADFSDLAARNGDSPPSGHGDAPPPDLSPEAAEPFPDGFVRLPFPDALIEAMPRLSDSAFRALIALIRLSFRFDPEASTWVCPDRTFSRAAVEAECGLSGQGTRNGLEELESEGYVSIDRSGQGFEYTLEIGVPSSRFTYVPTDLLEEASSLSGTELRLIFAVLRATWGWTTSSTDSDGSAQTEHKRWEFLSTAALARMTGRSPSAVKQAAQALQGTWLQRRRPTSGAYCYRFRTEVLTTEPGPDQAASTPGGVAVQKRRNAVFSMGVPNDLPPDRQQSAPPHKGNKESSSKRSAKHSATFKRAEKTQENLSSQDGNSAVRGRKPPSQDLVNQPGPERSRSERGSGQSPQETGRDNGGEIDLTGFSDRKRQLGQKLANVGVWPRRIPELLGGYSAERIEANFQLYRQRAPQIRNRGAWLAAAIEGGFALPSPSKPSGEPPHDGSGSAEGRAEGGRPALPEPGTKVSEARRRELIEAGLAAEADFDRFADYDDPTCKQHFYQVEKTPSPVRASRAQASRARSSPATTP